MNTLRQLLGGLIGGAIVVAIIAAGVLLAAGDLRIAQLPSPTPTESPARPAATRQPDTPTVAPTSTHTPTLIPVGICPRPAGWIDHIVTAAEDLESIAALYEIEAVLLQVSNCLTEPVVRPGQNLFVPALPTSTATQAIAYTQTPTVCGPPRDWVIYRVQPGDTLFSLARATGTTVQALIQANCLSSSTIRVGQALYVPRYPIPVASYTPTRTPTPAHTVTGSPTHTFTPSATPFALTPTSTPSLTATPTLTDTTTATPISSPTPSATVDVTPTATDTIPPASATPTVSSAP